MEAHALSISPILVIDDNHFERVYSMEINRQESVALTSNTTKVCDVSPTMYIEQTLPQSMHVCMNMNSLHILPTITGGGVSTIYKTKQQKQGKKHKTNSIKPSKTSPPLASIAKMGEKN